MSDKVRVEVAYALPDRQQIVSLDLAAGSTVFDAAEQSGLGERFEGLDLEKAKLGIFGKVVAKPKQQVLNNGDRIEIYRELIADPKEVRKQRAEKVKAEKAAAKSTAK